MSGNIFRGKGLDDIIEGLSAWRLWMRIGWMDTLRRYRRTAFGPFWTSLSVAIFIGTIGVMYSQVFHQDIKTYLPYLCSGFVVWAPLATMITESCGVIIGAEGLLKQAKLPYSMFVFSAVVRNIIVFAHHMVVYLLVAVAFRVDVNASTLLVFPGLLLVCLNAGWVGILIGAACARFRDLTQLIASLIQVAFFVTPIFWKIDQTSGLRLMFVTFNPLFHFIDIVRSPLLGQTPAMESWYIVLGLTVFGWAVTIAIFNRVKTRIIYWI